MKKFLSILFTLLLFVGNVWGECNVPYGTINVGWNYSDPIELDYAPSRITLTMTTSTKTARTLSVEVSSDGESYKTLYSKYKFIWGSQNVDEVLDQTVRFIRFHSDVIVGNQFKDIVIYKKQIINNTQNTQALTSTPAGTSITVNSALSIVYANPASNIAISATSNNGTVSVSPTFPTKY